MINIYEQIDRNKWRSILIIAIFIVFVSFVVYILGQASGYGSSWVGFGLIFSGLMSFASYYWSDKIILGISGAKQATKKEFFQFYTVVENLALASQLPMPRLYVINDTAPNAFATGRDPNHAVVCATTGLLEKLSRSELEGVIGHELSHIKNYDVRLMSIVTILVGMVSLLGDWFLRSTRWGARRRSDDDNSGSFLFLIGIIFALISPIIAQLIQLAISRRREFFADASSVMITKFPNGLINALEKISVDREPLEAANRATAHLYIVNPLKGEQITSWVANLFNTHPPIEQRIKALKEME
jgi:heat shock protein HtpX